MPYDPEKHPIRLVRLDCSLAGASQSLTTRQYPRGFNTLGWSGFDNDRGRPNLYEGITRDG